MTAFVTKPVRERLRSTIVAALFCVPVGGLVSAVWAQDASDWDAQNHTAARLIAGSQVAGSDTKIVRAGVEIKLDPGWKTYWRDPGDSGVPPKLDFAGSDNVKSVTVLWPAPERFPDGAGGNSIGYLDHVILPLRITPQDAKKQSSLKLKLGYDICSNMCVPVESDLKLAINGDGAEEMAIEKAEIRVPRRVALGEGRRYQRCKGQRRQRPRYSLGASRARRRPRPCGRRSLGSIRHAGRSVCRRPDPRLVVAAAGTQRRRQRTDAAIHLRTRWAAARRPGQRCDADIDRRLQTTTPSRFRPDSIKRAGLNSSAGNLCRKPVSPLRDDALV